MNEIIWLWEYEIETLSNFHSGIVAANNTVDAMRKINETYSDSIIEVHTLRMVSEGILDLQKDTRFLKILKERI